MEINPEQIIYLTYQLRQCEVVRKHAKKVEQKQAMTARIHQLHSELDPLLEGYAEQQKQKEPLMKVNRLLEDKDLGPPQIVQMLHDYANIKLSQDVITSHLNTEGPVSVAGQIKEFVYVIHFEKNFETP